MRPIELVDERLYHLDITFCPLDDRRALCAPMGWDRYGRKVVEALVPEPLWLDDDEALAFCANSVVVGTHVVMPATPVRASAASSRRGASTSSTCAVGEFLKAGGGCRCLTLALDVDLRRDQRPAVSGERHARPRSGDRAIRRAATNRERSPRPTARATDTPASVECTTLNAAAWSCRRITGRRMAQ